MRNRNSILNFVSVYGFYILKLLLDLYRLTLFKDYYGIELHALHQVYYNVFQCLSIAESGIGVAVVFKLYKPLADHDEEQINIIYSTLRYLFHVIAVFIIIASFLVSFALPFLINDNSFELSFLQASFMVYVAREVITYFLCPPQFVITADHQKYKINLLIYGGFVLEQIAEIVMIKIGLPYIVYLMPAFFIRIVEYTLIRKVVYKNYPFLKVVKERDKSVYKDVYNVFFINIFNLVHTNSDVICLSALTSSMMVSTYSFYNYIVKFSYKTTDYVYEALKNGVGNLVVTQPKEVIEKEMDTDRTLFSFIAVLLCTLLFFSMTPFIDIWAGSEFAVDTFTLVLFLLVAYCKIMLSESKLLVEVYGLFGKVRNGLLAAAAANIILSIILINFHGMAGVLLGTIITDFGIVLIYYSYTGYKHLLGHYSIKYFSHHLKNFFIMFVVIFIMSEVDVSRLIAPTSFLTWFIYSCFNGIFVLGLDILMFTIFYRDQMKSMYHSIKNLVTRKLNRKKVALK